MGAREVLGVELPWLNGITCAKGPEHVPVVLSRAEGDHGARRYGLNRGGRGFVSPIDR
jgi:hypothetical protein